MQTEPQTVYFDATLTPNRSLSPRAFTLVMAIICGISFLAGLFFVSMGAFPVLGFFGLDALIIWIAFRRNFRHLKQRTHVRVTAEQIELVHDVPGSRVQTKALPTAFTTLDLTFPQRKPSELRLSYQGSAWVIGRFLTPGERKSLYEALNRAIMAARSERYVTS